MPMGRANITTRFDIERYRASGRAFRFYHEFDIPVGGMETVVVDVSVPFLLLERSLQVWNGFVRYEPRDGGTFTPNGNELPILPLDSLGPKASNTKVYYGVTMDTQGVPVDLDVVRVPEQPVSKLSIGNSQDISRYYGPGIYELTLTNMSTQNNSQGKLQMIWGEDTSV